MTLLLMGCGGNASLARSKPAVTPIATSPNSADKSGYLNDWAPSNIAVFMQFTDQNGTLTGTGTETYITVTQGIASVTPQLFTISGSHVGDTVNLTLTFRTGSKTDTGTLKDGVLTLAVTQQDGSINNVVYNPASIDDYNKAVATIKLQAQKQNQTYYNTMNAQATVQAQATAQANQQYAVQNDNNGLTGNLNALKNEGASLSQLSYANTLNGYANDWVAMQKDYGIEQADAAKGCGDAGSNAAQVRSDDAQVRSDLAQINSDDAQLRSDKTQYDTDLSAVETEIKNVKGWWSQLQTDAANNTTHTPTPAYTADQVNQALSDGQGAETTALGNWNAASTKAQGYDTDAANLQKQADALANGMPC